MTIFTQLPSADANWLGQELAQHAADLEPTLTASDVSHFFDARQLACPMPLLKAKVTLKGMTSQELLYLIASDKNSQTDLVAFCQKNQLPVATWHSQAPEDCYHFLIQKS